MNANRMKYASTPTYGMQKRGAAGKKTHLFDRAPETPDFSRAPDMLGGAFPQTFFSTPTQPAGFPAQPYPAQAGAPFFPQGMSIPPMQNIPSAFPPTFPIGGYAAQPMQPYPAQGYAAQPPMGMPAGQPQSAMPPLRGANVSAGEGSGFSPRTQGFVPPQPSAYPAQSRQGNQQAQPLPMMQGSPAPAVQPAGYMGGMPMQNPAPMQPGMPMQNAAMQSSYFAGQSTMSYAPVQPAGMPQSAMPQQPAFPVGAPAQPRVRTPIDADKLWSIFLFGLLPLLFIPCIFVPQSLNFIRYAFLVLSVCGMGGMWYRQMYSSTTRVAVSVVYVALCIVTVSMLMQGSRDIRQTAADAPAAQQTVAPDPAAMAAAVTVEPVETPAPTPAGKSEAQMRLETFMGNWAGNRVEDMVRLVQPSWASAQDAPNNRLFMLLSNRTPEDYTIEDISGTDDDTSRTVSMTATINKNNGKESILYRFMVLMVKEGGEWYVDPNSLATNDEIKTEVNVVNDSKTTGLATAAPRMTVSPAPPPDTVLYYNPDGGKSYHASANCDRVKSEYLPLQGTFLYRELGNYDLTPCLACGAPTQTLPPDAAE